MQIKLDRIALENFKGVEKFVARFEGCNAVIRGRNGAGKTTIMDAVTWLLADVDSEMQSRFNILSLDQNGLAEKQKDAVVEITFRFDEKSIRLRKIYRQKWTKKKGRSTEEFGGHATECFWNDVPVTAKDFRARLAELIPLDLLRSLLDVHHFCGRATPQVRREILLQVAGDISDETIFAAAPELAELAELIAEHPVDDLRRMLKSQRTKQNQRLTDLPGRIDELGKAIDSNAPRPKVVVPIEIEKLTARIRGKESALAGLSAGSARMELEAQLARFDAEVSEQERQMTRTAAVRYDALEKERRKLETLWAEEVETLEGLHFSNRELEAKLEENNTQRVALSQQYKTAGAREYAPSPNCFACGQALPPDQIDQQRESFQHDRAEKLKTIKTHGTRLFAEGREIEARISANKAEIDRLAPDLAARQEEIAAKRKQIHDHNSSTQLAIAEAVNAINAEAAEVEKKLAEDDLDLSPKRHALEEEIRELTAQRSVLEKQLAAAELAASLRVRVEALRDEMREVGAALEETDRRLELLEQYTRLRAQYIEENVSEHFSLIRWKLFEQQVNAGVREICEATVNGVPYSTDLNTGTRINAGMDAIGTLSQHYNCYLPIFVDHAESVTTWDVPLKNQLLLLTADKAAATLAVEVQR